MKKLLSILLTLISLSAFGQAQSDASLSTQSTDEIKNKALNQTRIDAFNQDLIQSKSSNVPTANTQTGNYTFALTDIGRVVLMNVGSANDLTVPPNSSVAFPVNTMLVAYQIGAGTTTIVAGSGVTVNNTAGDLDIPCQGCPVVLYKTATDTWYLSNGSAGGGAGTQDLQDVLDLGSTATISGDYEVLSQGGNAVATHSMINQGGTQARHIIQSETTVSGTAGMDAYVNDGSNHYAQVFAVNTSSAGGRVDVAQDGVTVITGSQVERIKIDADGSWDMAGTTPGTSGQVLTSNGSGSAPSWQDAAGGVSDGDKGDITVSSSGTVWNIDGGVVTGTEIATSVALAGNPTTTTQTPGTNNTTIATTAYVDAAVTAGSIPDGDKGDITVSGSGATWTIDNLVVTPAKMSTFSSSDMRGKYTDETGTGAAYFQDGDIGTPSAGVGTNITGIPYANLTGTAPFWLTTGTTTLTGANTIVGSSANTVKMNFPSLGTTATDGAGIFLENTTAAAAGAQQISPGIILGGYGWRTNAVAESQSTRFRLNVLPVQGTSVPSANFQLAYSLNGGAFSNVFTVGTGTTRMAVTGIGTTSSSTNALFNDSGGTTLMELLDDGGLRWGNGGSRALIFPSNGSTTISKTGVSLTFSASSGNTYNYLFVNTSSSPTNVMGFRANPSNSSGNANTYVRRSDVTINNTGTYSGVFAYDYFEPTVTSATGTDQNYIINTNHNFKTVLGASSGNSTLDVDGSFAADITATSADLTLTIAHHTVVVDASGAARTITLPAAASVTRRIYTVINDTGTNTVTVDPNSTEVIGSAGATTYVIPATAGSAVTFQSNGTKWLILSIIP